MRNGSSIGSKNGHGSQGKAYCYLRRRGLDTTLRWETIFLEKRLWKTFDVTALIRVSTCVLLSVVFSIARR